MLGFSIFPQPHACVWQDASEQTPTEIPTNNRVKHGFKVVRRISQPSTESASMGRASVPKPMAFLLVGRNPISFPLGLVGWRCAGGSPPRTRGPNPQSKGCRVHFSYSQDEKRGSPEAQRPRGPEASRPLISRFMDWLTDDDHRAALQRAEGAGRTNDEAPRHREKSETDEFGRYLLGGWGGGPLNLMHPETEDHTSLKTIASHSPTIR